MTRTYALPIIVDTNDNCCRSNQKKAHWARDYYRRNKECRSIVHKCPHCNYETTGPKQCLRVHIWSKHTEEKDKPFQCTEPGCCRGFAQKSNLQKHLKKMHAKEVNLSVSRDICLFIVKPGDETPLAAKTIVRCEYYKQQPVIKANELPLIVNTEDGILEVTQNNLRYDARKGYIKLETYAKHELHELKRAISN